MRTQRLAMLKTRAVSGRTCQGPTLVQGTCQVSTSHLQGRQLAGLRSPQPAAGTACRIAHSGRCLAWAGRRRCIDHHAALPGLGACSRAAKSPGPCTHMTTPKANTSAALVARCPRMTSGASQRGFVAWREGQPGQRSYDTGRIAGEHSSRACYRPHTHHQATTLLLRSPHAPHATLPLPLLNPPPPTHPHASLPSKTRIGQAPATLLTAMLLPFDFMCSSTKRLKLKSLTCRVRRQGASS